MIRKMALCFCGLLYLFMLSGAQVGAQEGPNIHVDVNLVQINVAVTDNHGNYITGLRPSDFTIAEDGIGEKIATFAEGNEPVRNLIEAAPSVESTHSASADASPTFASLMAGAN